MQGDEDFTEDELFDLMKAAKPKQSGMGKNWQTMDSMAYQQNKLRNVTKIPAVITTTRSTNSQFY